MSPLHPPKPPSRTWRIPPGAAELASLWFWLQRQFIEDHAPAMKRLSEELRGLVAISFAPSIRGNARDIKLDEL